MEAGVVGHKAPGDKASPRGEEEHEAGEARSERKGWEAFQPAPSWIWAGRLGSHVQGLFNSILTEGMEAF